MNKRIKKIYPIIRGDDSTKLACLDIPEDRCTELPCNYLLNVVNGAASKIAEQVGSA